MILGRQKVGVIGMGLIGTRVASCLRKAGYATYVWSRTPKPLPNFLGSIEALAAQCPILQIFVSDDRALADCIAALAPCVSRKHVVLNHATVSPEAAKRAAEAIDQAGAWFLNAPFTGSKEAAENAQLVYYVGGDSDRLDFVRKVLEASSKKILHVGGVADAAVIKIATNLISATTVQVLAEALTLCRSQGVPDNMFAEALAYNGAHSGVTDIKLPKMISGDFSPHFEVRHMLKDTRFGLDLADQAGIELPATATTAACLLARVMAGEGSLDFATLIKNFDPPVGAAPGQPAVSKLDVKSGGEDTVAVDGSSSQPAENRIGPVSQDESAAPPKPAQAPTPKAETQLPEKPATSSNDESAKLSKSASAATLDLDDKAGKENPDGEAAQPPAEAHPPAQSSAQPPAAAQPRVVATPAVFAPRPSPVSDLRTGRTVSVFGGHWVFRPRR